MFQPLRHRLAGLATLAALLSAGSALAQSVPAASVRIFEEPPPMELLRSIMVPESRSGLTRRIVLGVPDQPAPLTSSTATPERSTEAAPIPPAPRRTRPQGNASSAMMAAAGLVSPLPAHVPEVARPASATPGSIGFRINFALNSDVVPQSAFPFIDRIAELLREQLQVKLQVEGHTDALGSDAYNLDLSQRRAAAVANYLVDRQGIEATRLVVLGMGEGAPLVENGYDPRNRRVQFARVD
jgi:outer membrane protein OmpA-like peptidoglycan-associated protein